MYSWIKVFLVLLTTRILNFTEKQEINLYIPIYRPDRYSSNLNGFLETAFFG